MVVIRHGERTLTVHEHDAVSRPSLISARILFDPTRALSAVRAARLVPTPGVMANWDPAAVPLLNQVKVSGSEFASTAFAVRFSVAPTATTDPVEDGDCPEQMGGEFFTIFQVFESELVPLLTETWRVLFPPTSEVEGRE